MDSVTALQAAMTLVAIGGSWGGAKVALQGTRERVQKLEIVKDDHTDRLARIETKLDILLKQL